MIDHPFMNLKSLSEDELLDKTTDLQGRLGKAHMWGSSTDIINQLEWMLEMIEEEKYERMAKVNHTAMQSMFPDIVESEPELVKDKGVPVQTTSKPISKAEGLPKPNFDKVYLGDKPPV